MERKYMAPSERKVTAIGAVVLLSLCVLFLLFVPKKNVIPAPQPLPDYPTGIDSSRLQEIEAYYQNQIDSLKKHPTIIICEYEKTDYSKLSNAALWDSVRKYYCTDTLH